MGSMPSGPLVCSLLERQINSPPSSPTPPHPPPPLSPVVNRQPWFVVPVPPQPTDLGFVIMIQLLYVYVHAIPDRFWATTKIILDRASVHSQEGLWRRDFCDGTKLHCADLDRGASRNG